MRYVIDGIFLCKRITGIQRYAIEITKELDKIVEPGFLEIAVPERCTTSLDLKNIRVVRFGKKSDRLWEQIDLVRYLKRNRAQGLFFENTIPLLYRHGVVTVHDVSLKANPSLFATSIKGYLTVLWRLLMYSAIMNSGMKLITVSEFSKKEIIKYYRVDSSRITVAYNAWQHMDRIERDDSVFQEAAITPGEYYFAMATIAPNKNFRWIAEAAKNNPDEIFVIAGGGHIKDVINEKYSDLGNLVYLGYVSDERAKSLMAACKGFIFPSFYEGFGIPPLEAAACGAPRLILSDIECLHEIYGDNAVYVDSHDYKYDFNNMYEPLSSSINLLSKYSWKKSAEIVKDCCNSIY